MGLTRLARLVASLPPGLAAAAAGAASPFAVVLARRGHAAWEENVGSLGLRRSRPRVAFLLPHYHHLLLLYESLAMLGGRRFTVELHGEENLHQALAQRRGLLLATAHVGNWHLGARAVHERTGRAVHSVAGTQMLRGWTGGLRLAYRRFGLRVHPRPGASARLLRILRRGGIVALHLDGDQHAGSGPATRGIALLSRRSGAPIVPVFTERVGVGSVAVVFRRPIGGGRQAPDAEGLTAVLIDLVKDRPEQWTLFRPLWGTG